MPRVFYRMTPCCLRGTSCPEKSVVCCPGIIYCTIRCHQRLLVQGQILVQSQLCSTMVEPATMVYPSSLKAVLFLSLLPCEFFFTRFGPFSPLLLTNTKYASLTLASLRSLIKTAGAFYRAKARHKTRIRCGTTATVPPARQPAPDTHPMARANNIVRQQLSRGPSSP